MLIHAEPRLLTALDIYFLVAIFYPIDSSRLNLNDFFSLFQVTRMKLLLFLTSIVFILNATKFQHYKLLNKMSEQEHEEDDDLIETSFENSINFHHAWRSASDLDSFLHRENYISVRGTCVNDPSEMIYDYDIDGITILWNNVGEGLSSEYTHFDIASRVENDLKPIYTLLKKHIKLEEYTLSALQMLKHSLGCQLIYHGGWETWLGLIPKAKNKAIHDGSEIRRLTMRYIAALRNQFQKELLGLIAEGQASETLAKNNIFNLKKMFILPGDRKTILKAFQHALESTTDFVESSSFYPVTFSFRFGEKCQSRIDLPILDATAVSDICVHAGIRISSHFHDLFWCRNGVNQVIGKRGQLSSTYSFFECVNFQSNLDNRSLDVSGLLRSVSQFPDRVRFIQMYSDIPHRRPMTRCHPISGSVILVKGILTGPSQQKLYKEALDYLSELKSNFFQFRNGYCRLELVACLPSVYTSITPIEMVNTTRLFEMFRDRPMIAPFSKIYDMSVIDCLREVGLHLQSKLQDIYSTRQGTGDSWAVWNAYQYEIACEKLLWGHPFSYSSRIYAINLGPGLDNPTRSLTDQMGFLCLENCFTCCSDETSTPPLNIYAKNQTIQTQITRLFGLSDLLGASAAALGIRIMLCLLKDLHGTGSVFIRFADFLLLLKASSGNANKRVVGGVYIKNLIDTFINAPKCKWPIVFKMLQSLIHDNSKLERAMQEGINSLKLGYFPAIRSFDSSRSEGLNWKYTYGFWVISDLEDTDSILERRAGSFHVHILSELEKRKICHTAQYEKEVFQWIKPCLEKLPEQHLDLENTIIVLTFVTSICLLMNNKYIDYLNLSRLERCLPLHQRKLQSLEILSKFKLDCVKTVNIFRAHPSIPHQLSNKRKQDQACETVRDAHVSEDITVNVIEHEAIPDEETASAHIQQVQSRHIPMTTSRTITSWNDDETMILARFIGVDKDKRELYEEYRKHCRDNNIPDHPFNSFRKKLYRMSKA